MFLLYYLVIVAILMVRFILLWLWDFYTAIVKSAITS